MRMRMEIRRCFLRHKTKILFVLFVLVFTVTAYCVKNKLLYMENNLPFMSKKLKVPYAPEYNPTKPEIPKIIHQTWKSGAVPTHFATWMKSWHEKHPDYEYWFWTDDDARRLLTGKYPEFLPLFDSYAFNIQRADVIRYFILYEYGGIYSDLDVEVMRPIDGILTESCYLSQEPLEHAYFFWGMKRLACNAIMACRPRHPFFYQVLEGLKYYKGLSIAPFVKVSMPVMESSGPKMITYALDEFDGEMKKNKLHDVFLWPAEYFFPDADKTCMPYVKKKCSSPSYRTTFSQALEKVCQYHEKTAYTNQPHENPYAVHHWSHTYYGLEKSDTVKIEAVDKNVKLAANVLSEHWIPSAVMESVRKRRDPLK